MPFEYWMLPSSENRTTRIVNCNKVGKYIVFTRDDGKECRYDLSTGETIGFRGKPVKSLASQLKDLTCERMFKLIDNDVYRQFFQWVWKGHMNGKAWVFFQYTMPDYVSFEQYFTSGYTRLQTRLIYGFDEIPKAFFKLYNEYELTITNKLVRTYLDNPDAFNLLRELDLGKCTNKQMIEAMVHGCDVRDNRYPVNPSEVNPNNLLERKTTIKKNDLKGKSSYFISLINNFGYTPKLLFDYVDSVKIGRKFTKNIFQSIYDYADMMTRLYDKYDRYPENFAAAHRRACTEINRVSISYNEVLYQSRNVLDYECEIDGFKFIYPRSTKEIKAEGINQHNCVATYIDRVLNEGCHIMFMRPVDNPDESYITLEIRNSRIVQAKRKYNENPSNEEKAVIKKWNKKFINYEEKL